MRRVTGRPTQGRRELVRQDVVWRVLKVFGKEYTAGVSGLGLFWRDIIRQAGRDVAGLGVTWQARNGLGSLRGFWLGKARSDKDYKAG